MNERQNFVKKIDDFDVDANQIILTFQQTCDENHKL